MKVCGVYEGKDALYISRWVKSFKGKSLIEESKVKELRLSKMERVVLAVPARSVLLKSLELPFSDAGKIRGALPFEMAEELAGEASEYAFSFYYIERRKSYSKVVGGAAKRELLERETKRLGLKRAEITSSSLAFLNSLMEMEGLREDTLYCFKGESEGVMISVKEREITFERSLPPLKVEEEASMVMSFLKDNVKDIKIFDDPMMIARGAALGALEPERFAHLNLLEEGGVWKKILKENERELKRIALALALLLGAWGVSFAIDYRSTMMELKTLERRIEESYRRYFGEGKVVNPILQAKRKVEELESNINKRRSSGTLPLLILEKISESIPASLEVKINGVRFTLDRVEIEGVAKSFEDVDSLKKSLSRAFKSVEVSYARLSVDGKSVSFGIVLKEMI